MAETHPNTPIPHHKWTLDTPGEMFECAERLMELGMYSANVHLFINPQEEAVPIRGEVVRTMHATKDKDDRVGVDPFLGEVVVLIDFVNLLKKFTPDEYAAQMGGAQ